MKQEVELRASHLIIPPALANDIFNECTNVYVAFKEETGALLLSPKTNTWFSKIHQSMEFILKSKDLKGTKSVAIREILIDHELDDSDRVLSCTINEEQHFLKIEIK